MSVGSCVISDKPSAPQDLSIAELTSSSMTLRWEKPLSDGGSPVIAYIIKKWNETTETWDSVKTVKAGSNEYTLKKLKEGSVVRYAVLAKNVDCEGDLAEMQEAVTVPKAISEILSIFRLGWVFFQFRSLPEFFIL